MIDNNEESLKSTKDLIKGDNRCFAGDVTSATFTKTLFKQVQVKVETFSSNFNSLKIIDIIRKIMEDLLIYL